ncbi:hypothetical protein [Chryseobacterium koreense]
MKNLFLSTFIFPISCMMTNTVTSTAESVPNPFTEMTAVKSEKCDYLLQDKSGNNYEVTSITSKIPNLSQGKKVWVTYQPLRRMSVCGAQPIEILEVYKK